MKERGFKIGGLGEIAIRCNDLAKMSDFYEHMIGLEPFSGTAKGGIIFSKSRMGLKAIPAS